MLIKKILILIVLISFNFSFNGCATSSAPTNWLPDAEVAQVEAYGAWIEINLTQERYEEGEFIAISKDSIFVFSELGLQSISKQEVLKAKLTTFDSNHSELVSWTLLGSLSTASHGIGLILSLPVWLIAGITSTASQSHNASESFPSQEWEELTKFARYPAGLPNGKGFKHLIKQKK